MCGIVGYTGSRSCRELLLNGLGKLEYRGYDSAGLSLVGEGRIESVHAVGKLSFLQEAVAAHDERHGGVATLDTESTTGIAHTRWATHGRVTHENAHPHDDSSGRVHIVMNGIVENWSELRRRLESEGAVFTSETDTEVVAHLIAWHLDAGGAQPDRSGRSAARSNASTDLGRAPHRADPGEHHTDSIGLLEAVRRACAELRGHYSFVAVSADEPDLLVGTRKETPLVVGRGEGESFFGSAISAFLPETRRVQFVEDDEIVAMAPDEVRFFDSAGQELEREITEIDWDESTAEKGGHETFMLKEIHEQPDAIAETVGDRLRPDGTLDLDDLGISDDELRSFRRVLVVACGTSYHAGVVARYAIEEWSGVPVGVDIASEFRYRKPLFKKNDLVVGITQSGETADTLAAMRLARSSGAKVIAITNVMGSQATRDADGVLFTRAGLEIGVAATKTFVAQTAAMYLLGLKLVEVHGGLSAHTMAALGSDLRAMPHLVQHILETQTEHLAEIGERFRDAGFFLYLGRHAGLPIALEGALKMKEISYVPSDAYAAGEMKHGPIALLDDRTPVVCVATDLPMLDKMLSNMAEVQARGAHVIAVATEGAHQVAENAEEVVYVPQTDWLLQPLLAVVPLQLLAYFVARARGLNIDQPRNLAKTVTVE
ncbi:MAG: glutamine--fructose-6-phosphate transaminase (isomerizing) [Actinomycetota bacterium]|nr:glutamine--fructose-6-phosphate transaminase (isomerizing) [Actinomycetota bacterium]